jgi:TRAP-type C4-dicarboxylate transport system permease small subunit
MEAFKPFVNYYFRALDIILVFCMVVMLVLVFANVVMRFGFNSGIDISEELPRFAFVWMTFIGAVVGMHKKTHLGVDMLVAALPILGRKICWGVSQAIIFVCALYMLYGTWLQNEILSGNVSPIMQISMIFVYGVSYLTSIAIAAVCVFNLVRLFLGQVEESELIDVQEEGMDEVQGLDLESAERDERKGARA